MSDAQRARTNGGKPGFVVCIDLFHLLATQQLAAPKEGEAATITIPLLPEGDFDHPCYGQLSWTQRKFNQMKSNFDAGVLGYMPSLNFDHRAHSWINTDSRAAAWFKELVPTAGKGLDAVVELTPCGAEAIRNREYRYISAEVKDLWQAPTGESYANVIVGGALTNHPYHGMMEGLFSEDGAGEGKPAAYCFSEVGPGKFWAAVDRAADHAPTQGGTMSQTQSNTRKFGEFLRSFLGLKEGATPEELHAAIDATELDETPAGTTPATVVDPAPAATGNTELSAVQAELKQLSTQMATVTADLKKAREDAQTANQQLAETHAAAEVDALITAGKVAPAQRESALKFAIGDPVLFKEHYENAQPVIDLSEHGKHSVAGDEPGASDADPYLAEVNKKVTGGMLYSEAADVIAREKPELYAQHVAMRRRKS